MSTDEAREQAEAGLLRSAMAAAWCLFLLVGAYVYHVGDAVSVHRHATGKWHLAWESGIPYVSILIVPYWSVYLLLTASFFICTRRSGLAVHTRRVSGAIVICTVSLLLVAILDLIPLAGGTGLSGGVSHQLMPPFGQPGGLFPSLHVTLLLLLWSFYVRHASRRLVLATHACFGSIALVGLLTWQCGVVDVVAGLGSAAVCFYLFPESSPERLRSRNPRVALYYAAGTAAMAGAAVLMWPARAFLLWAGLSFAVNAAAYVRFGPGIYRKANGLLPLSTWVVMAPCLLGQFLSLLHYRRHCRARDELVPGLWIGARLSEREAREAVTDGIAAVLDLTAEFRESRPFLGVAYHNLQILDLTAPDLDQLDEGVAFITRHLAGGQVFVHCKIGYSRTAAVAGAYLLASGGATSVDAVVDHLKAVRPSIVVRPEARAALTAYAEHHDRRRPDNVSPAR